MPAKHAIGPVMTQVSLGEPSRGLYGPLSTNPIAGPLPQPPQAHLQSLSYSHSRSLSNEPYGAIQAHSSVSSEDTGSLPSSAHQKYPLPTAAHRYHLSSQAETGSMGGTSASRYSHRGSQAGSRQEMSTRHHSPGESNAAVYRYVQEHGRKDEEDHAIWVLMWLSFLDPFFSFFSAIFSIVAVFVLLLISPIRLCQPSCSFGTSTIRTIAPLFRNHLRLICAPSVEEAHTFDFKPVTLVVLHLVSPVLSIGVAVAAWIAAAFWLFALIMGNPDGTERKDDGRAAVLTVRDWWERFLLSAVR